jgi:DNA-binding response OmpR family regulator
MWTPKSTSTRAFLRATSEVPRTSSSTRLRPHRVLLVDDDADERDAIASFLELQGADVAVAGDGQAALNALQADPLRCLILLDLQMPGMNGWEFRRRQLVSSMAGIPVVVVSGIRDLTAAIQGMSASAAFGKPVELELLLGAVGAHCGGH